MTAAKWSRARRHRELKRLGVRRKAAENQLVGLLEAENAILLADAAADDRSTSDELAESMGLAGGSAVRQRLSGLRHPTR